MPQARFRAVSRPASIRPRTTAADDRRPGLERLRAARSLERRRVDVVEAEPIGLQQRRWAVTLTPLASATPMVVRVAP